MKIRTFFITLILAGAVSSLHANGILLDSLYNDMDTINQADLSEPIVDRPLDADDSTPIKVQKGDTTYITLGKKRIRIFEEDGETNVKIEEKDKMPIGDEDKVFERQPSWKNFKGHWAGISGGPNNLVDKDFSFERIEDEKFMDINPVKSWNFNVNFAQYSIGLGSDKIGLTTGLGIEWSNYHFSDTNIIQKQNGIIVAKPTPESTQKKRKKLCETPSTRNSSRSPGNGGYLYLACSSPNGGHACLTHLPGPHGWLLA